MYKLRTKNSFPGRKVTGTFKKQAPTGRRNLPGPAGPHALTGSDTVSTFVGEREEEGIRHVEGE